MKPSPPAIDWRAGLAVGIIVVVLILARLVRYSPHRGDADALIAVLLTLACIVLFVGAILLATRRRK